MDIKIGIIPAILGMITIGSWILVTHAWAKDTEDDVEDLKTEITYIQQDVVDIKDELDQETRENKKLRKSIETLILELKLKGSVTEAGVEE